MTGILRTYIILIVLSSVVLAQDPRLRPGPKKGKDDIKMENPPGKKTPSGEKKKAGEGGEKEPEAPKDPFDTALEMLATWPAPEAREAAASLALEGPAIEKKLIERLSGASPGLTAGIAFVLGEVGGDAVIKELVQGGVEGKGGY